MPKDHAKTMGGASSPLTTLQLVLFNSLFGGRVKLEVGKGVEKLKSKVVSKWSRRAVPEAIDRFTQEHGPSGMKVPRAKEERIQAFWDLLTQMD